MEILWTIRLVVVGLCGPDCRYPSLFILVYESQPKYTVVTCVVNGDSVNDMIGSGFVWLS